MTFQRIRLHLMAAFLTLVVFAARAYGCPDDGPAGENPVGLRVNCPAPYNGHLYSPTHRAKHRADIAALDELVLGNQKLLAEARAALAECRKGAADKIDDCAADIPDPVRVIIPTRVLWPWAAAAAGAGVAPLAVCRVTDCGSAWTPWVSSAAGAGLVVFLAWVSE